MRELFFSQSDTDPKTWICRCGKKRKVTGSGYTNLVTHIRNDHPTQYIEAGNGADTSPPTPVSYDNRTNIRADTAFSCQSKSFLWKPNTVKVHGWLQYVVHNLRPFDSCENDDVVAHVKYPKMDVDTLLKYMELVTKKVEKKIAKELPDKFAIVIDGWSEAGCYYLGTYASFPANNSLGYKTRLLSFSPLEDETTHSADQHLESLKYVLSLFGKSFKNVIAIIADNCATNRSLSRLAGTHFIGCASHRYNLAVKDVVSANMHLIEKVKKIMSCLIYPLRRAKLRELTDLAPVRIIETRWSSVNTLLQRYVKIREHLEKLDIAELQELLLERREEQNIDTLLDTMKKLNSITLKLQRDDVLIAQVRKLFDIVVKHMPTTNSRLDEDAEIVQSVVFESALVKLQLNEFSGMSVEEKKLH